MKHILRLIAVIIAITYALKLVNAQSDWLVFSGLAVIAAALYFLAIELKQIFTQLNSKR